jgi:hypothetical protein
VGIILILVVLLAHCLNPSKALLSLSSDAPPLDDGDDSTTTGVASGGVAQLKQLQRRLPVEQIMQLVRAFEAGAPASELARQFGIDKLRPSEASGRQAAALPEAAWWAAGGSETAPGEWDLDPRHRSPAGTQSGNGRDCAARECARMRLVIPTRRS